MQVGSVVSITGAAICHGSGSSHLPQELFSSTCSCTTAVAHSQHYRVLPCVTLEEAVGLAGSFWLACLCPRELCWTRFSFLQVLSNSSSFSDILSYIPDDLVDQVPNSLLALQGSTPDLRKVNEKHWSPQQVLPLL